MQRLATREKSSDTSGVSARRTDLDSQLFCTRCGERFSPSEGTDDGWYYRCPNADCSGAGIYDDLYPVRDVRPSSR